MEEEGNVKPLSTTFFLKLNQFFGEVYERKPFILFTNKVKS
jgi:hypothetical protein